MPVGSSILQFQGNACIRQRHRGAYPLGVVLASALAAVLVVVLGSTVALREGYTPDEEITHVLVEGISAHGVPLLPSGVLYTRGLPYHYLAWLSGAIFGHDLLSYRFASVLCGVGLVIVGMALASAAAGGYGGAAAGLLLATFPPLLAASGFGRYYTLLLLLYFAALLAFVRWASGTGGARSFLAAAFGAACVHPVATSLVAVPALHALCSVRERTRSVRLSLATLAACVLPQAILLALHGASLSRTGTEVTSSTALYAVTSPRLPPLIAAEWAGPVVFVGLLAAGLAIGWAWIRRYRDAWSVVPASVLAGTLQLGVLLVLVAVLSLLSPRAAAKRLLLALVLGIVATAGWSAATALRTDAEWSLRLVGGLAVAGLSYPLGALRHLMTTSPFVFAVVLVVVARLAIRRSASIASHILRLLALLGLAHLLVLDVLGVPLLSRYLLIPSVLFVLNAAIGPFVLVAVEKESGVSRRTAPWIVVSLLVVLLGHYMEARSATAADPSCGWRCALSPPTGTAWTPERVTASIRPDDVVVCTEELACRYLVGRVDALWTATPADAAHYVVNRGVRRQGFYGGAPAVGDVEGLAALVRGAERCAAVVALNTGKVGYTVYREALGALPDDISRQPSIWTDDLTIVRLCGR